MKISLFVFAASSSFAVVKASEYEQQDHEYHEEKHYGRVRFTCRPIPSYHKTLPFFSLGKKAQFPSHELDHILESTAPKTKGFVVSSGQVYYDGVRAAAFYDHDTGETSVYPQLEALKAGATLSIQSLSPKLDQYLQDGSIFSKDDTHFSLVKGHTLSGAQKHLSGSNSPTAAYLSDVRVERNITHDGKQYSICGPGTKATFSFASDGKIHSFSHRWRAATIRSSRKRNEAQLKTDDVVHQDVAAQLASVGIDEATVDSLELCFYDSGKNFIQPVYRYRAIVLDRSDHARIAPVVGYVPATSQVLEELPNLKKSSLQPTPSFSVNDTARSFPKGVTNETVVASFPKGGTNESVITKRQQAAAQTLKVGRYVMHNDTATNYSLPFFVPDANEFLAGLRLSGALQSIWCLLPWPFGRRCSIPTYIDWQYYWDEPFHYTTDKERFVNSVDVAFTVGHGNIHKITTNGLQPDWGQVLLRDIPESGFGPGANGSLAYWFIHDCSVISTPDQVPFADAFDDWWHVFNGLHAVLGYRTAAWVDDNTPGAVAAAIGGGASVVPAWLKVVNEVPGYNPPWKIETDAVTHAFEWAGRPAAINVCGHADDTLFQRENLGRPGCLQLWWYDYAG